MGWEVLVIPIIGVAVWIISTVIRGAEEAKRGGPPPGRKRPEKVTDLDRFLRDVQRRREAAEREERRPSRVEREEEEERIERRRPQLRPSQTAPVVEEAIPVVIPVEPVPVAQPVVVAPVLRTIEAPPLPVMAAPVGPAPSPPRRPPVVAAAGVRELLRSRDGLRKVMILREVLGPPLALRRGRFPGASS
jgi:hypothetical protein